MGVRIRGTLGDRDPLNKVPLKRASSRVKRLGLGFRLQGLELRSRSAQSGLKESASQTSQALKHVHEALSPFRVWDLWPKTRGGGSKGLGLRCGALDSYVASVIGLV